MQKRTILSSLDLEQMRLTDADMPLVIAACHARVHGEAAGSSRLDGLEYVLHPCDDA